MVTLGLAESVVKYMRAIIIIPNDIYDGRYLSHSDLDSFRACWVVLFLPAIGDSAERLE